MTIQSEPVAMQSVNDPLVWAVYDANSEDTAKLNYKYIADVYINSVLVFRAKIYPDVNYFGVFDLSTVIRQYVNAAFKAEQAAGEFTIEAEIKFGEEYDFVAYPDLVISTYTLANYYNGRRSDTLALADFEDFPATIRDKDIEIVEGSDAYYVPYYATTTTPFDVVVNGTTTTITPTAANTMHRINIADPAATANYTADIDGTVYNVKLVCDNMYKAYYLHFLNQYGGWESMLFNKASKKTYNVDRKSYQQLPYRVSDAGAVSIKSGNVMNDQRTVFGVQYDEKIKIMTDWVSDNNYKWLRQLVCSPFIYLQDGDTLYSCMIEGSNYEEKTYNTDSLSMLSLDISFGVKHNTQFR